MLPASSAQFAARAAQTSDLIATLPTLSPNVSASDPNNDTTAGALFDPYADADPGSGSSPKAFNYLFIIILVAAAILSCIALFLYNRRRKRRAAILRLHGRNAPARDGHRYANGAAFTTRYNEGLDERGEAPPAYFSGDKPPSIQERTTTVSSSPDPSNNGNNIELRSFGARGDVYLPPGYDSDSKSLKPQISRPPEVAPAPLRPVSIRSVLSHSETSAHQGS